MLVFGSSLPLHILSTFWFHFFVFFYIWNEFSLALQIFGENIKDAELSEDVLVISHSNSVLRFYSFRWIIEHCTVLRARLGERVEMEGGGREGRVGEPGFGVPITVKMTGLSWQQSRFTMIVLCV